MKLKINANPYTKQISYQYAGEDNSWKDIDQNSKLMKYKEKEISYYAYEIIDKCIRGKYDEIEFEGSNEDFEDFKNVIDTNPIFRQQITKCEQSDNHYLPAEVALQSIEGEFSELLKLIKNSNIQRKDEELNDAIGNYKNAVLEEIPVCIMGLYSSGKSAFINALIGAEILPSETTTTTAKTHKIKRSADADKGKISFVYNGEKVEYIFDKDEITLNTASNDPIFGSKFSVSSIKDESAEINESAENPVVCHIYTALRVLNEYDMAITKDNAKSCISDEIEINVPSSKGIFEDEKLNFVVYDTPGSNSATREGHTQTLAKTLREKTNGLPILVTTPDNMNDQSIENIIEKTDGTKFDLANMIVVVNKADTKGDHDLKKLNESQDNIVKNWQATRIYFVSAILGLGSQKKEEPFFNKTYEEPFDDKKAKFTDPNHSRYMCLYKYNIMPEARKNELVALAEKTVNSGDEIDYLYVNSGLQCVVEEVKGFAGHHSLYNKCVSATDYLNKAQKIVREKIKEKESECDRVTDEQKSNLDNKRKELIKKIDDISRTLVKTISGEFIGKNAQKIKELLGDEKKNINKKWIEDTRKSFGEIGKQDTVKKIEGILVKKINNISEKITEKSKAFFLNKDEEIRQKMLEIACDKKYITDEERGRVECVIREFPKITYNVSHDSLIDINKIQSTWFFFFSVINNEKLANEVCDCLETKSAEQNSKLQQDFTNLFKDWIEKFKHAVTEELTNLNPKLIEINKKLDQLRKDKFALQKLQQQIEDSNKEIKNLWTLRNFRRETFGRND